MLSAGTAKGKKADDTAAGQVPPPNSITPRPRPEVTMGVTEKIKIGCGNLYVSVNADEQGICEIFTNTGRAGGCASQSERQLVNFYLLTLRYFHQLHPRSDQRYSLSAFRVKSAGHARQCHRLMKYMDVGNNDRDKQ